MANIYSNAGAFLGSASSNSRIGKALLTGSTSGPTSGGSIGIAQQPGYVNPGEGTATAPDLVAPKITKPTLTGASGPELKVDEGDKFDMNALIEALSSSMTSANASLLEQIKNLNTALVNPLGVSTSLIQGRPTASKGITLAEQDLERRRGTVSRAYLGTKRLQTNRKGGNV